MEIYTALYIPTDIFEPMTTVELTHDNTALYNQLGIRLFEPLPTGDPFLEMIHDEESQFNHENEINIRATVLLDELRTRNSHPQPLTKDRAIYGNALIYGGYDYNEEKKQSLSTYQEQTLRDIVEHHLGDRQD